MSQSRCTNPASAGFSLSGLYMHRFNYLRQQTYFCLFLIGATLLVLPQFSRADDYYWTRGSSPGSTHTKHSTPEPACLEYLNNASDLVALDHIEFITQSDGLIRGHCYVRMRNGRITDTPYANSFTIRRFGNGCTTPAVYNSQTHSCQAPEPNKCESKIGDKHSFGGDLGQMETCVDGCLVVVDMESPDPIMSYKKGATENTYWWVSGIFSGEQCNSSGPTDSSPPPPTSSDKDRECTPTTTNAEGAQVSSCTETEVEVDNQGCVDNGGFVGSGPDGVMRCIASKKGPKATETKTKTEVESKTNPDGSKDEKTTKTKDKKVCSGSGSCSSSTTTNVSNNHTNSDGSAGNSSSSCSGAECASSGTGNQKGEGDGQGEGDEEGEGPAGPSGSLKQGEAGSFAEGLAEWDQRLNDARTELDQKVEQLSAQFRGVFDLDLSGGSGSLPCDTVPVSFGKTSVNLRICPADYSDQLSYLRFALLLGAAALGGIIVLRG